MFFNFIYPSFPDLPNSHDEEAIQKCMSGLSKSVKASLKTFGKMHLMKVFVDLFYLVIDLTFLQQIGVFTHHYLWKQGHKIFYLPYGNQFKRQDGLARIFPKIAKVSCMLQIW